MGNGQAKPAPASKAFPAASHAVLGIRQLVPQLKIQLATCVDIADSIGEIDASSDMETALKRCIDETLESTELLMTKLKDVERAEAMLDATLSAQESTGAGQAVNKVVQAMERFQGEVSASRVYVSKFNDQVKKSALLSEKLLGCCIEVAKTMQSSRGHQVLQTAAHQMKQLESVIEQLTKRFCCLEDALGQVDLQSEEAKRIITSERVRRDLVSSPITSGQRLQLMSDLAITSAGHESQLNAGVYDAMNMANSVANQLDIFDNLKLVVRDVCEWRSIDDSAIPLAADHAEVQERIRRWEQDGLPDSRQQMIDQLGRLREKYINFGRMLDNLFGLSSRSTACVSNELQSHQSRLARLRAVERERNQHAQSWQMWFIRTIRSFINRFCKSEVQKMEDSVHKLEECLRQLSSLETQTQRLAGVAQEVTQAITQVICHDRTLVLNPVQQLASADSPVF